MIPSVDEAGLVPTTSEATQKRQVCGDWLAGAMHARAPPLNPIFGSKLNSQRVRDPAVWRDPGGEYHLFFTHFQGGEEGSILHVKKSDLTLFRDGHLL